MIGAPGTRVEASIPQRRSAAPSSSGMNPRVAAMTPASSASIAGNSPGIRRAYGAVPNRVRGANMSSCKTTWMPWYDSSTSNRSR